MNYSSLLMILLIPLGAGEIPDLFSDEDVDKIISGIRNEVRGLGMVDSRENCWKFFLARVRLQLKVRNTWLSLHLVKRAVSTLIWFCLGIHMTSLIHFVRTSSHSV